MEPQIHHDDFFYRLCFYLFMFDSCYFPILLQIRKYLPFTECVCDSSNRRYVKLKSLTISIYSCVLFWFDLNFLNLSEMSACTSMLYYGIAGRWMRWPTIRSLFWSLYSLFPYYLVNCKTLFVLVKPFTCSLNLSLNKAKASFSEFPDKIVRNLLYNLFDCYHLRHVNNDR